MKRKTAACGLPSLGLTGLVEGLVRRSVRRDRRSGPARRDTFGSALERLEPPVERCLSDHLLVLCIFVLTLFLKAVNRCRQSLSISSSSSVKE